MYRLRSLVLSLSSGYVLMFFSEHMFWARVRPGDTLGNWLQTWLAYSLLAFVFLTAVWHFRAGTLAGLFIAGSLVGWLAEGAIVQTLYDEFPLHISWTGLAWHALLSVCLGWYGLRRALAGTSGRRAAAWSLGLGLFWGMWAIFWRVEEPAVQVSGGDFAAFAFTTTALLGLSLWLYARAVPTAFHPSRPAVITALAVLVAAFSLGTIPVAPTAIVVLPVLLGLVVTALARHRRRSGPEGMLLLLGQAPLGLRSLLPLALLPIAATLVYASAAALDLRWQTNWLVYLVTMPAGFLLFGIAWLRLMRGREAVPPSPGSQDEAPAPERAPAR
jgi:hypothetical protein